MKKDNSIYKTFSDLSAFIKLNRIPLKESQQDEESMYSQEMMDVKQICNGGPRIPKKVCTKHLQGKEESDPRKLLEETIEENRGLDVVNLPEYMEGYAEGINPISLEKLRSGEFSVEKTLDLHGCASEVACRLFEDFIKEAIHEGLHCVKVVHGRGLKSKDMPVLKESLKRWIVRAMHRKWIVAFSSARMCDGGPGATYILLKKRPSKRRIRIIG